MDPISVCSSEQVWNAAICELCHPSPAVFLPAALLEVKPQIRRRMHQRSGTTRLLRAQLDCALSIRMNTVIGHIKKVWAVSARSPQDCLRRP